MFACLLAGLLYFDGLLI